MDREEDEINRSYNGLLNCVTMINSIIDGSHAKMAVKSDEEKKERVKRNYEALEKISSMYDDWGEKDFSTIDKAIIDGKAYVG